MASSPISRLRFLGETGVELDAPLEWTRCLIGIDCPPEDWQQVALSRNGLPMPVFVKELGGQPRVLADWPLSGAGNFELTLEVGKKVWRESQICSITPRKLSAASVEKMLSDLQRRLPASIAIALQRGGALAGVDIVAPEETTLAEELRRLTRAVDGTATRPGLADLLRLLADRPYEVLRPFEQWSDRERARRIDPSRLAQAFSRPANLDKTNRPLLVPERPVEHSVDVYENRLLKAFHDQVNVRLRRLLVALQTVQHATLAADTELLLRRLVAARRAAAFLDRVAELTEPPARITMVLLKRSEYRAVLEGFLEFRRRTLVKLDDPAIDAPLENLPHLYETWGVLEVIVVLLNVAADLGFRIRTERLIWRRAGELWVQLLKDGQPAVVLVDPNHERAIKLVPQRTYGRNAHGLHSVSFSQKPDVAVELLDHSGTRIYIFDPKYKLDSEEATGEEPDGRPKKVDIDAMHSYRDSIRDEAGRRAVEYAAILYPGQSQSYIAGLAAIRARPEASADLRASLAAVLGAAITEPVLENVASVEE